MIDINREVSLIKYLQSERKLNYKNFISWVGKNYNESNLFQSVMHDCTSISDGMDILLTKYHPYDFPEEFWLSKIAENSKSNEISVKDSVAEAYNLLNLEGSGNHNLSSLLYSLVDDYSEETMNEYMLRIKESNFEELLQTYNFNHWTVLHEQVFGTKI